MKKTMITCLVMLAALLTACSGKGTGPVMETVPETIAATEAADTAAPDGLTDETASDAQETTAAETSVPETAGQPQETDAPAENGTSDENSPESGSAEAVSAIRISEYEGDPADDPMLHFISVAPDEPCRNVLFEAEEDVTDFQILHLEVLGVDDEGRATYHETLMYGQDSLSPGDPLCAGLLFVGNLPEYGFTYTDKDGNAFFFVIAESGMDGSLILVGN